MNWFTSLPQWFKMLIIAAFSAAILYRLVRYGITLKVRTPGGAEAEIDADNSESEKISSEKDSTSGEGK